MMKPHKEKYHSMYWAMAWAAAAQSVAERRKVGAIVVTPTGMLSVGWNAMPAGFPNECEQRIETSVALTSTGETIPCGFELVTKPEVIHAERNAIDKMTRQGVPVDGSLLFITLSPCLECAKSIHGLGFSQIFYWDQYRCTKGVEFLQRAGVPITHTGH